jgi:acetyltransferase-like isoleucine patch superfamily enzyme
MNIKRIREVLFSINPKTIYFNFKYFPFRQAIRFPVLVAFRTYLFKTGGEIVLHAPLHTGMIRIGFGEVGIFDNKRKRVIWEMQGKLHFYGSALIKFGSKISVGPDAELHLGDGFRLSPKSTVVCLKKISFGNNVRISWESFIIDGDFHKIKNLEGEVLNHPAEIRIGNNVWIGMKTTIMKGTEVGDNVIIGAGSFVNKKIDGSFQIIAGHPARVVKQNVTWEA